MRRKDREIFDKATLMEILDTSAVCRIAFKTEGAPYIVPLNFGYEWDEKLVFYFHCAKEGRKLDLLRRSDEVGFELDMGHEMIRGDQACDWGMKYRSIIGVGKISRLEDMAEKSKALDRIMNHYDFKGMPSYNEEVFKNTVVLKMTAEGFSGKEKK